MKKQRKRIIVLIIIVCVFFLILFFLKNQKGKFFNDDLIFFKSFHLFNSDSLGDKPNAKEKKMSNYIIPSQQPNSIFFNVKYNGTDLKNVNIADTIDSNTLVNEKIAPGTTGEFEIIITSNEDLNYRVKFHSKNEKPANMNFYIRGNSTKYKTLEELQNNLVGKISKNEVQKIYIKWKWDYANNDDEQDTKDGKKLKEYNFDIYTEGFKEVS